MIFEFNFVILNPMAMICSWPPWFYFLYKEIVFVFHVSTEIIQILEFAGALFMATFKDLRNIFSVLPPLRKPIMSSEVRKAQTILYTIQEIKYNFEINYCKICNF